MGHFPFEWQEQDLWAQDFDYFQNQFNQTILQLIPFAEGPVTFLDSAADPAALLLKYSKPQYWLPNIKRVIKRQRASLSAEKPVLFLPVWNAETIIGIAAVEGVDDKFADALSDEWLSDRSRIISREFFLLKQQALDGLTGMFNGHHLHNSLAGLLVTKRGRSRHDTKGVFRQPASLLLMEIYPRASYAAKAINSIVRTGYFLESFLGHDVLYHLGNGIWGLIEKDADEEQARKLGKHILSWCRREGFHRIHIGINTVDLNGEVADNTPGSGAWCQAVLEQTWQALLQAGRRGSYALCTYSSISSSMPHPLQKPNPAVLTQLRELWADADRFAILLISRDRVLQDEVFAESLRAVIEPRAEAIPAGRNEMFVFLRGADEKRARAWIRGLKKKLPGDLEGTYSTGIACFPCIDFKKSDVVQNARKALLHAGFFGPDTTMVFDGISQNVSGDIYYGEGDLVQAIKEYRKGLELDPANTNLLNSLGEAFAQMNKPGKAIPFFEAVLEIQPHHFMALFNLGVTSLSLAEDETAIAYFEKALAVSRKNPAVNRTHDLLLQLVKLYCRTGGYKKTVALLEKEKIQSEAGGITPDRCAFLRYLGEAYMMCGRTAEAIPVLQRAVRFNPHDAGTLSILGELYARENQGNEIALSLCLQAINIDEQPWQHWYRLAVVRYGMADYGSALEALEESLHRERMNIDSLYLAGRVYVKQGKEKRATAMFEKVLKIAPDHGAATKALEKLNWSKSGGEK
jgi:tetratricopeptide (TPR) repeat protein